MNSWHLTPAAKAQERRVSLAEIEAALKPQFDPRWGKIFDEFKSKIQDGDELWEFCSDRASWDVLTGHGGFKIVRGDVTIGQIIGAGIRGGKSINYSSLPQLM